ncbi:hypothetical protein HII36_31985 [Nonomuraea sp. NN258]|uniref:hypothetical protein n=1 Tax=Nonomuraea antri TaxID=2730852 RepID=UPI001567CF7E|nr:hypothetical protein [Nonomuraea antri]NRQ36421.1 hypothetical protein [Nonomuraea antri]
MVRDDSTARDSSTVREDTLVHAGDPALRDDPHGVDSTTADDPDSPYRDPYARTDADMQADPLADPRSADVPDPLHTPAVAGEGGPAHAAPRDLVLFDQDPAQVQARWRDVQASFVDDPGEAVTRADALVGEVVEAITSTLTTRTNALRDGWKGSEQADTEQLRLALRDYRNVLERLLALSAAESSESRGHRESGGYPEPGDYRDSSGYRDSVGAGYTAKGNEVT